MTEGQRPELFSVRAAAHWLQAHGVKVHENTVRHWTKTGRITTIPRPGGVLIAKVELQHIAACPFCGSR